MLLSPASSRRWPIRLAVLVAGVSLVPLAAGQPAGPSGVVATLKGHAEAVYTVAFSPNGNYVVTGSFDNTLKLWEAKTGKEVKTFGGATGHQRQVLTAAFSPDGHTLASGGADNTLKLWDVPSSSPLRTLAHADALHGVALSPDGTKLATAGKDGTVKVWNAADFKPLFNLIGHNGPVTRVAFSNNGLILASSSSDKTVRYWSMKNGEPLGVVGAHTAGVSAVALHPNNTNAYSVGGDGQLKFWQMPPTPTRLLAGHTEAVNALAISADGTQVLSAGADKTVRGFTFANGQMTRQLTGPTAAATSVASNANATSIAAGSADSRVYLWNAADNKLLHQFVAHAGAVTGVSFRPQNTQLLTGGNDGLLKVWAMPPLPTRTLAHPDGVLTVVASPDGKRLVSGGADKILRSWDTTKNAVDRQFTGHTGPVTALALSANGQLLVSGGADSTIRVWNQTTGKESDILGAHGDAVSSLALNATGTHLLSASEDGTVKLWQLPIVSPKLFVHPALVHRVVVAADGSKFVTGSHDNIVRLWNLATGAKEREFPSTDLPASALAISPDGKWLAVGSPSSLTIWSTGDGKVLKKFELFAAVTAVAFHPDNKQLAAAVGDTIRLFDVAQAKEDKSLKGHTFTVTALAYTAKGELYSASPDKKGTVRGWDVPAGTSRVILEDEGKLHALALSRDGSKLAIAAGEWASVWDVAQGKRVAATKVPYEVRGLEFAPDGKRLLVGGADGRARIFDLDGRLMEFFHHSDNPVPLLTAAFHPDGKRIITVGADKLARVWTSALVWQERFLPAARQVCFTPKGDQAVAAGDTGLTAWDVSDPRKMKQTEALTKTAHVRAAVTADGSRLLTSNADGSLVVWALNATDPGAPSTAKPLMNVALGKPAASVCLSPNGQRVAVSLGDKQQALRVFEVSSGREMMDLPEHTGRVRALAFLGDNRTLISASEDKTLRLSDVNVLTVVAGHNGSVAGVQFHSNGTQALTAGADGAVKLWDMTKGQVVKQFAALKEPVRAVTFNRDFTQIGAASDKAVRVWNLADGKELMKLEHPAEVTALSFSVDKTRIVTGAADKLTRVWDAATGKELQFFAQPDGVHAVAFHDNNTAILSAGGSKSIVVDTISLQRAVRVGDGPLHALTLTPNGSHVLTGGADKLVSLWNTANGVKERTLTGAGEAVHAIAVSKNNLLVAAGGADKSVRLYNFADGKELRSSATPGAVRSLAFSPNSATLAAGCADKTLATWNVTYAANQPLPDSFLKPLQVFAHDAAATDAVFAADNATLYSTSHDKTVKVWKVAADAPSKNFPHPNIVDSVAFNPTNTLVATGGHDGKVRIFDLAKGAQIREINAHPKPNEGMIYGIAFSPDGKYLVSASYDTTAKLWDVNTGALVREFKTTPLKLPPAVCARAVSVLVPPSQSGPYLASSIILGAFDPKQLVKGHDDSLFCVAFSPDGKYLATGSAGLERAIKIWNVADGRVVRELPNPKLKRPAQLPPQSHPGWIYNLRYTKDGKLVSVGDAPLNKGYLAIWQPLEGKLLYAEEMSLGTFYAVAISPDDRFLAIGAGPRGRPVPELNSAYVLQMPAAEKK